SSVQVGGSQSATGHPCSLQVGTKEESPFQIAIVKEGIFETGKRQMGFGKVSAVEIERTILVFERPLAASQNCQDQLNFRFNLGLYILLFSYLGFPWSMSTHVSSQDFSHRSLVLRGKTGNALHRESTSRAHFLLIVSQQFH